jgi:hypothetical protein
LYNKLLHKYNFGQAHCLELRIRVHTKFNLKFLDLPMSFSRISNFEIHYWNYLNEKENIKGLNGAWAESGPWPRPFGRSGLVNRMRRPVGVAQPIGVTMHAACRWRGHHRRLGRRGVARYSEQASVSEGATRRRRRSLGTTAFSGGVGCTVVTNGRGVPLPLGGGGQ